MSFILYFFNASCVPAHYALASARGGCGWGAGFPLFRIVCDGWLASENDFLVLIFYLASFFYS